MYEKVGNGSKLPVTGSTGRGTGKARSFRDWRRLPLPVLGFLWRSLCSDWKFRNGNRKGEKRGRLDVSLLVIVLVCSAPIREGRSFGEWVQRDGRMGRQGFEFERTQLLLKQSCEQK